MRGFFAACWFVALLLGAARNSGAETILVPHDHTSIQGAIRASRDGDIVLVAPGTYRESINFLGKAVSVVASAGASATTIDAERNGSAVTFATGEGPDSSIEGFSIVNGWGPLGGGVSCIGSSPTVRGNLIRRCGSSGALGGGIYCESSGATIVDNEIVDGISNFGGGIYLRGSHALVSGNTILRNEATGGGGGIYSCCTDESTLESNDVLRNWASSGAGGGGMKLEGCRTIVYGNLLRGNVSSDDGGGLLLVDIQEADLSSNVFARNEAMRRGGGLSSDRSTLRITGNLFWRNAADWGGAIHSNSSVAVDYCTIVLNEARAAGGAIRSSDGGHTIVDSSILWENTCELLCEEGVAISSDDSSSVSAGWSIIEGGFEGTNVSDSDPLLANIDEMNCHLRIGSPAIDSGNPSTIPPALDLDGHERQYENPDIGADEFLLHLAARFGAVGAASGRIEDVVLVNGSAGGPDRVVHVTGEDPIAISILAPTGGPISARYVLYAWLDEPDTSTAILQKHDLGWTCFPMPLQGEPSTRVLWNNLGYRKNLGKPLLPSTPAPTVLGEFPWPPGLRALAIQGLIQDLESTAVQPISVTNALVIRPTE